MAKELKRIKVSFARALSSQLGEIFSDTPSLIALFFLIIGLSIVAGWVPDGLNEIFFGEKAKGLKMLLPAVVILLVFLGLGKWIIGNSKYAVVQEEPKKRKALILFLSPIWSSLEEAKSFLKELSDLPSVEEKLKLINNKKIGDKFPFRSWRMPAEAIKYHLPKLEVVKVITSEKTSPQFSTFVEFLKVLFPEKELKVEQLKTSSFEDFKEIEEALEKAYSSLKEAGYKEKEIILDITGGQKIVSIVGALLSLYGRREFQYVSTNDYSVKSYDVEVVKVD
jgi:hypothetical protein